MNFGKILIVILFILYIINPLDLIPEFFPPFGWLDDAFAVGVLIYYLKRGRFPDFFFRRGGPFGAGQSYYRHSQGTGGRTQSRTDHRLKDPYEVLGIKPGASAEEIRTAYRRAVQIYHPDKVTHLGEEFQELAKQKFVEVQEAYNKLTGK
jgi:DnaJ-domain-containing protein 1